MNSCKMLACIALAFSSLATAPACAEIVTFTFDGTLSQGSHWDPVSGSTGYNGAAYSVTYTLDTAVGGTSGNDVFQQYVGGSVFGYNVAPLTAVFTVAGLGTFTSSGNSRSLVYRYDQPSPYHDEQYQWVYEYTPRVTYDSAGNPVQSWYATQALVHFQETGSGGGTLLDSAEIADAPTRAFRASDLVYVYLYWVEFHYDPVLGAYVYDHDFSGTSNMGTVTYGSGTPGTVPEPECWLMMGAGLGILGAAARHRPKGRFGTAAPA